MIPQNIKSEHILKAIEEVKRSDFPAERGSEKYDLEYDNQDLIVYFSLNF